MTPHSKKLLGVETKSTLIGTSGQPASQLHSRAPGCFRTWEVGGYRLLPEVPDRSSATPLFRPTHAKSKIGG
jgi:hypothetical protein